MHEEVPTVFSQAPFFLSDPPFYRSLSLDTEGISSIPEAEIATLDQHNVPNNDRYKTFQNK